LNGFLLFWTAKSSAN